MDPFQSSVDLSVDSIDAWSLVEEDTDVQSRHVHIQPKCKPSPLPAPQYPQCLSRPRSETLDHLKPVEGGLAAPSRPQPKFDQQTPFAAGLHAPERQSVAPKSLQLDVPIDDSFSGSLVDFSLQHLETAPKRARTMRKPTHPGGPGSASVTRVRCASDSSLVRSLWNAVIALYLDFSPLLQQLESECIQGSTL
eukprot:s2423_g11.t1